MVKIVCEWAEKNKFLVNPDGQVWPCCYLANPAFKRRVTREDIQTKLTEDEWVILKKDDHPLMDKYIDNMDDLNINNKNIEEILTHEWFTKTLPNSWLSNPHRQCKITCGVHDDK